MTVGFVNVLLVKASEPAKVAKVPVVGNVTLVAAVAVNVKEYAPEVTKLAPSATVKVADVAGAVKVNLLMLVAVATPKTGVINVGLVSNTIFPVPVTAAVRVTPPYVIVEPNVPAPVTDKIGIVTVPVKVGDAVSDFELTAVAILSNSVLISVPLTIFKGSPEVSVSFVAKLVDFV